MGNETSRDFRDNSLLSYNCSSDYDGIQTAEESSLNDECIPIDKSEIFFEQENEAKNVNTNISQDKDKIPVTFEWDKVGNSVYVTGDFCGWKQLFLMEKKSNELFILTLNLSKGFIKYKFIVDNQWKYNEKFPMINDENGNINNYIDTSNWEISAEGSETKTNANTNSSNDLSSKYKLNKSINSISNYYSTYVPKIEEMNDFAPKVPGPYKSIISLKKCKEQNSNENNKDLPKEKFDFFGDKYSYKKIKSIKHEEINHVKYKFKNVNKKPVRCSIVSRYRLKFTSFFYYK